MRKVFVLLLLFCAISTQAQVSNAWKIQIESTFQHVDRTAVTTGLLNDYGIYFTNIDKFNGMPGGVRYRLHISQIIFPCVAEYATQQLPDVLTLIR